MSAPLDPALAALVPPATSEPVPSLFELDPAEARTIFNDMVADKPGGDTATIVTEDIEIALGAGLRARTYRPRAGHSGATIVFLHGGGYVLGGVDQMDREARVLCELSRGIVLSVDYRLAPEHPLPAAHDDAVMATRWAHANIEQLGGDVARLCIAGESAGANLAASAAIALRDEGIGLAAQLLIVPAPDFVAFRDAEDCSPPYPMLSARDLRAIAAVALANDPELASRFPYSAAHADDLSGLAPAVIGLAGHCPVRAIGQAYAERLRSAGNFVRLHDFADLFHPFFAFTEVSPKARCAAQALCWDLASIVDHSLGHRPTDAYEGL